MREKIVDIIKYAKAFPNNEYGELKEPEEIADEILALLTPKSCDSKDFPRCRELLASHTATVAGLEKDSKRLAEMYKEQCELNNRLASDKVDMRKRIIELEAVNIELRSALKGYKSAQRIIDLEAEVVDLKKELLESK